MRRLVIVALLGGCGGTPFPNFVGVWSFTPPGAQLVASCPTPVGTQTRSVLGNLHILPSLSGSGDLVTLDEANGCDVTYTVMGNVATGVGNLVCVHPSANAANTSETDTTMTITLTTSDGKMMTESASGTADFAAAAGALTCPFVLTATLTKVSNTP